MKSFLDQSEEIFNEELSYDVRRIKFAEACQANISVFNAMFQMYHKYKDHLDNFDDIV